MCVCVCASCWWRQHKNIVYFEAVAVAESKLNSDAITARYTHTHTEASAVVVDDESCSSTEQTNAATAAASNSGRYGR